MLMGTGTCSVPVLYIWSAVCEIGYFITKKVPYCTSVLRIRIREGPGFFFAESENFVSDLDPDSVPDPVI